MLEIISNPNQYVKITPRMLWVPILIICLVAAFYMATVRPGHDWGGDFALYITHARNIAEGRDYAETAWVYNPHHKGLSPKTYPPVTPVLLAPLYKLFGFDLRVFKRLIISLFLIFLAAVWRFLLDELGERYALYGLISLAFLPFFYTFCDQVISDIPFLLFSFLALYEIDRVRIARDAGARLRVYQCVMVGTMIFLAYGTRSVGLLILPAMILMDLIRKHRITLFTWATVLVFFTLKFAQSWWFHKDGSYLDYFVETNWWSIRHNLVGIPRFLYSLLVNQHLPLLSYVATVLVAVLAVAGYGLSCLKRLNIWDVFFPIYLTVIILWPAYQGGRFLIPLIPMSVYYIFLALKEWSALRYKYVHRTVMIILVLLLCGSYASQYWNIYDDYQERGVANPASIELFEFIKQNTQIDDKIVFFKPRVLSLYTDRPALVYHRPADYAELVHYMRDEEVDYVIVSEASSIDQTYLRDFLEATGLDRDRVFANPDFEIYRL